MLTYQRTSKLCSYMDSVSPPPCYLLLLLLDPNNAGSEIFLWVLSNENNLEAKNYPAIKVTLISWNLKGGTILICLKVDFLLWPSSLSCGYPCLAIYCLLLIRRACSHGLLYTTAPCMYWNYIQTSTNFKAPNEHSVWYCKQTKVTWRPAIWIAKSYL